MAELLDLWSGEFLEGEDIPGGELDMMVRSTRDRMTRRFVNLALTAVANIGGPQAELLMNRALQVAPFNEEAVRANLLHLASLGRIEDAAAFYRDFCSRLRNEMNAEVEIETRVLAGQLLPRVDPMPASRQSSYAFAAAFAGTPVPAATHGGGLPRLLILPPTASMGGAAAAAHAFGRMMVSDLTLYLGKMRTFAVIAPFTARAVDMADPLASAGRIDANYVVTTRILSSAGRTVLAFALMESATGEVLLADMLPIDAQNLETSEAALVEALAASIAQRISGSELLRFHQTGAASAFAHYLLGVERLRYDLPAIRKARKHFQRAADLAPDFSTAIAMIARTLNYEWLVLGRSDNDILHSALPLAKKAVEIDPLNPAGHWEVGHSLLYLHRLDESLVNIGKATERAPHLADLLADEADVLVHSGEFNRALEVIDRATALNPITPDEYLWVRGSAHYFLGDYRQATAILAGMRDTEPVSRLLAASAAMAGDLETAARYRKKWLNRYPDFRLRNWVTQIPLKALATREQMIEGMRRAGFR
jgi:tetratricopeptide (TPR) repeat protein